METDVAGCSKGNWQRLGLEPYFHHFPFFSFRALSTNTWNHLEICRTAATQKFYEVYDDEGHIVTNYHVIECLATQMSKTFKLL